MNFSAQSIWEMTKLFIIDPAEASRRVLEAELPLNVSVLMIVLSGVVSGVLAAIILAVLGPQMITMQLADGSTLVYQQASPMMTGAVSVIMGLSFAYFLHNVGRRFDGTGSLPQVMSVIAAWQIALTVLTVAAVLTDFVLPLVSLFLSIVVIYVSIRGLGHAVKAGHGFDSMGKTIGVIVASVVVLFFFLFFVMFILVGLGLGPEGVVQ